MATDEVPPYSPTAASNERVLPRDYFPRETLDEDERPTTAKTAGPTRCNWSASSAEENALRPIAIAPPTATSFPFEPPPDYAPIDALASSFHLENSLIYAMRTSNIPRYQLHQEFTRTGKPRKLNIRRPMTTESRSHSLPSSSLAPPQVRFDEDATMYTITAIAKWSGHIYYEMRGLRSSTLSGKIELEASSNLLGGKCYRIQQLTNSMKRDSLNPDNEAKLQKYGYHAGEEWDKRLLFFVKKGRWEDAEGILVALEDVKGKALELLCDASAARRDLLVSCWAMRMWSEGLRWEGDVKGW